MSGKCLLKIEPSPTNDTNPRPATCSNPENGLLESPGTEPFGSPNAWIPDLDTVCGSLWELITKELPPYACNESVLNNAQSIVPSKVILQNVLEVCDVRKSDLGLYAETSNASGTVETKRWYSDAWPPYTSLLNGSCNCKDD
ncbi:hypothetical protein OGAPHI_005663 [Ogataea philodendri]|uniref:Uncharacterized protein n=1 Tax=Ogataea philodendri TaxID=1378263 RepID=A0A9P8P018_9ASCO|nr:uncharacterized protein OGAPHI_005663 [Ogataea philodendri]KAH3662411.1 hypothetical protein OGAPHI_005663 [Ogataea philodendri]